MGERARPSLPRRYHPRCRCPAVGGGGELLAGCADRAPLPHVIPARVTVHCLAVRCRAQVGLGRLRCSTPRIGGAARGAERAAAVQDVNQMAALLRDEAGLEPVGEQARKMGSWRAALLFGEALLI